MLVSISDQMEAAEGPLIVPDADYASAWFVDEPIAQGALKHAVVIVLDELAEGREALLGGEAQLDDLGALALLPASVRPAMTPGLIDKLQAAVTIIGWKLAQPGDAIRPSCVGEELALELVRRAAVDLLELTEAGEGSVRATTGVFDVGGDADILDLFEMKEPSDAVLALSDPINRIAGKVDMRMERWFVPFTKGDPGASHPVYEESDRRVAPLTGQEDPLRVVTAGALPEGPSSGKASTRFRVQIRTWADDHLKRHEMDRAPDAWLFYVDATSAEVARQQALERFPAGARQAVVLADEEDPRLDRPDLARISIDVQRVGMAQEMKDATATFHMAGNLELDPVHLPVLAALLDATFDHAVVMTDSARQYLGVSVNAESFDETAADLEDALERFGEWTGLGEVLLDGATAAPGSMDVEGLKKVVERFRREMLR